MEEIASARMFFDVFTASSANHHNIAAAATKVTDH